MKHIRGKARAKLSVLVPVLCLVAFGCAPQPAARLGIVSCEQFPDTHTLTNGVVVVVVAPRLGRVIGYHRTGRPNVMWLNQVPKTEDALTATTEWNNYGGDKIWISPQHMWGKIVGRSWPPETTTDGDPWRVIEATDRKLVMTSRVSPHLGVRAVRAITLPDDSTTVRLHHRLQRVEANEFPVHVWTVSQTVLPDSALLSFADSRPQEIDRPKSRWRPDFVKADRAAKAARFEWPTDTPSKVGTFGTWVAGVWHDQIFAQYAALDTTAEYADNSNCEVFISPTLHYMELELLSPAVRLKVGESIEFTVTWKLLPGPAGATQDEVVRIIEANRPE